MTIDGTYDVAIQAPGRTAIGILRVKVEEEVVSGSYEAHEKTQPLTGSITGKNVKFFTAVGDAPQQIKLEFTGVVSDNEITGTARANDSEPSNFTATKRNQ